MAPTQGRGSSHPPRDAKPVLKPEPGPRAQLSSTATALPLWGLTANSMITAKLLLVCLAAMAGCRAVTSVARLPCPYLCCCLQNYLLVQQLHHHFHMALLGGQVQGVQPILEETNVGISHHLGMKLWRALYSELLCRHDCRHLAHAGESPGWWGQEGLPCP